MTRICGLLPPWSPARDDSYNLLGKLQDQTIAGAAIDVTVEEPLPAISPLWSFSHVLITPHTAGETRNYEENVLDILVDCDDQRSGRKRPIAAIAQRRR